MNRFGSLWVVLARYGSFWLVMDHFGSFWVILADSIVYKAVVRAILFENFTSPSAPIFLDLKILRLHDLFQLKLLSFVYDSVNKISPACFHSFFPFVESIHQYGTWQVTKNCIFVYQKNTLQYGLRSVSYHGAKCWNNIPVERSSPSAFSFRRKLKAFLFENNYQP